MPRRSVTARVGGMGRDAARGASDPRLSFESMNVRVVAGDRDNGALCVTSERGTERLGVAVRPSGPSPPTATSASSPTRRRRAAAR